MKLQIDSRCSRFVLVSCEIPVAFWDPAGFWSIRVGNNAGDIELSGRAGTLTRFLQVAFKEEK